jgi:MerR family copper efflux transcriptional regulator
MSDLTSGQLAERCGVGIEAIRYYERKGLLPPPARSRSGYRRFAAEAVDRLRFIRQAQYRSKGKFRGSQTGASEDR